MKKSTNGTATKTGKRFTTGSVNYIKSNAGKMSVSAIANVLHRSVNSVVTKMRQLGLSSKVNNKSKSA